jgi:Domain of unknown function (DUF5666)
MKAPHPTGIILALLFTLLLSSCGGSGPIADNSGGIGGSGITSQGEITGFGSILVNGTVFDTRNALIIVQREEKGVGDEAVLQNLNIGKVVTVEGSVSDNKTASVANRVIYNLDVMGPVEEINAQGAAFKEIKVLGQRIKMDGRTKLEGTEFDSLALNDVIEVSGFIDDTGTIQATFIEKAGEFLPGLRVTITGIVRDLDTDLKTFNINDLTVDYSGAELGELPGGAPVNGLAVDAVGVLDDAGGRMIAAEIEPREALSGADADEVELEGFVTTFTSVFEFSVGNQAVETDAETMFVGGRPEDVQPGVRLEVEGVLEGSILVAGEVEFWNPNRIEIEGLVTDFISAFEFSVGDQRVRADEDTVYENGEPEDIAPGGQIDVEGVVVEGIMYADKISFGDV